MVYDYCCVFFTSLILMFCFVDAETALYTELWHACAGPLVTVPREGERVFYFPQGHIEQVGFQISFIFSFSLGSRKYVQRFY